MYNKLDQDDNQKEHFLSKEEVEALVDNFHLTIGIIFNNIKNFNYEKITFQKHKYDIHSKYKENMTIECDTLKPKLEEAKVKLTSLKSQKQKLESELSEFKHKLEFYQPQINDLLDNQKGFYQKNPKINQIFSTYKINEKKQPNKNLTTFEMAIKQQDPLFEEEFKQSSVINNVSSDNNYQNVDKLIKLNDSKLSQQEQNTLQSALQMYISESEMNYKNERRLNKLFSDSLKNREEVLKKEARLLIIQYCIHCKQRFSPLSNDEGSCVFHMGKLKFYSCKTCGCDEYYNCCGKCLKCCKGCATGKHAAKEKVFRHETTPQSKPKTQSINSISESDFYSISLDSIQFISKQV